MYTLADVYQGNRSLDLVILSIQSLTLEGWLMSASTASIYRQLQLTCS